MLQITVTGLAHKNNFDSQETIDNFNEQTLDETITCLRHGDFTFAPVVHTQMDKQGVEDRYFVSNIFCIAKEDGKGISIFDYLNMKEPVKVMPYKEYPLVLQDGRGKLFYFDENGYLFAWSSSQMGIELSTISLDWRKTSLDADRYDDVTAETPIGIMTIQWKGDLMNDSYSLFIKDDYIDNYKSIVEAKNRAGEYLMEKAQAILTLSKNTMKEDREASGGSASDNS